MEQDLKGKTIIITGGTDGIGLACARELARMQAELIILSRSESKCDRVAAQLRAETGNPDIHYLVSDLSSQASIHRAAEAFKARWNRLDVLVNNAGAAFLRRKLSADGIEMTFALNHLSYFLLTNLLLDQLKASPSARVVNVSSNAQYQGKIRFHDLQLERGYRVMKAYSQSKLANMLFTFEIARRLEGTGVTVNALHPGLVRTKIGRNNGFLARAFLPFVFWAALTPEEGARTMVYLAASPEVEWVTGRFYIKQKEARGASAAYDTDAARRLWEISAQLTGLE
jgi:NAD(P)-dependent dehydrogenase (short-subunit alcohol dehydrogenase family)